jgi:hypothetical protein
MSAGDLRVDVPVGRWVDVGWSPPQPASFDTAADDQPGQVLGDQDVVETVADPTALEGAGPRPQIKGWEGVTSTSGPFGSTPARRLLRFGRRRPVAQAQCSGCWSQAMRQQGRNLGL